MFIEEHFAVIVIVFEAPMKFPTDEANGEDSPGGLGKIVTEIGVTIRKLSKAEEVGDSVDQNRN